MFSKAGKEVLPQSLFLFCREMEWTRKKWDYELNILLVMGLLHIISIIVSLLLIELLLLETKHNNNPLKSLPANSSLNGRHLPTSSQFFSRGQLICFKNYGIQIHCFFNI